MTYASSTLGSTSRNPIIAVTGLLGGGNPSGIGTTGTGIWRYASTHTASELTAAQFITDAVALGAINGDIILGVTGSAGTTSAIAYLGVLSVTTAGGANISTAFLTSTAV